MYRYVQVCTDSVYIVSLRQFHFSLHKEIEKGKSYLHNLTSANCYSRTIEDGPDKYERFICLINLKTIILNFCARIAY